MRILLILGLSLIAFNLWADNPQVTMNTNKGEVIIELYAEEAPLSVENFLKYVDNQWYDDTIFHRVIPGFMIQGGGFTRDYQRRETDSPVRNEANNGLHNQRGTVAMARTRDPHSATNQFFINTVNNVSLNHRSESPRGWGYTVFGRVISGMDVVDSISAVATGTAPIGGRPASDVPLERVIIHSISRLEDDKTEQEDND